jgi:glutathione S-transferase
MADLHLYHLPPSPNNVRVRLALKHKGLAYEDHVVAFDDAERKELIELSTQPLAPVLKHGEAVIFDSGAILRYLDANFPATPRLFSTQREEMRAIEEWEYFSRTQLMQPVGITFQQAFAETPDPAAIAQAQGLLQEHTARVEEALAGGPWLLGERLTAADLFAGPLVALALSPKDSPVGVVRFFAEHYTLGEGREKTLEWAKRLMAIDA